MHLFCRLGQWDIILVIFLNPGKKFQEGSIRILFRILIFANAHHDLLQMFEHIRILMIFRYQL